MVKFIKSLFSKLFSTTPSPLTEGPPRPRPTPKKRVQKKPVKKEKKKVKKEKTKRKKKSKKEKNKEFAKRLQKKFKGQQSLILGFHKDEKGELLVKTTIPHDEMTQEQRTQLAQESLAAVLDNSYKKRML